MTKIELIKSIDEVFLFILSQNELNESYLSLLNDYRLELWCNFGINTFHLQKYSIDKTYFI